MEARAFFDRLYARIDAMDAPGIAEYFTEKGIFRLGNADAAVGPVRIQEFAGQFFSAIRGIRHELQNCWTLEDRAFCTGLCTYVRKDGSELTVPWSTVSRFEGNRLGEYLVYVDASKLFNP